jgi:hypothetical protein
MIHRNGANGIISGLGEDDSRRKPEATKSRVTLSLYASSVPKPGVSLSLYLLKVHILRICCVVVLLPLVSGAEKDANVTGYCQFYFSVTGNCVGLY